MSNDQPNNQQPSRAEPDRELLWDFVYGLLDEADAADVRARISADTAWARAYADVVLQCEELAEAAKVQDGAHDWSAVRESAHETTSAPSPNGAAHTGLTVVGEGSPLHQDRWRRRMTRFLSVSAAALLVVSLLSGRRQAPDAVTMIGSLPELTIVGPASPSMVDVGQRFDVDAVDFQSGWGASEGEESDKRVANSRAVTIRLQTMEGEPLPNAEATVALANDGKKLKELKVQTDDFGAATFAYDADQPVKKVNVYYLQHSASLDVAEDVKMATPALKESLSETKEATLALASKLSSESLALSLAQTDKYQVVDFLIDELSMAEQPSFGVSRRASRFLHNYDLSELYSFQGAGNAKLAANGEQQAKGIEAMDKERGENGRSERPLEEAEDADRAEDAPMLGSIQPLARKSEVLGEAYIVEAALEDKPVYVLNGLANEQGVVRAMIPRDLEFSELQLRSQLRPEQRAKWSFERQPNVQENETRFAISTPTAPKVARNWDSLEETYQRQWRSESSAFIAGANRTGVLGLALAAGMLVIISILYFLRAAGAPACAAALAASIVCLMASVASLQSAAKHSETVAEGESLFGSFVAKLDDAPPEMLAAKAARPRHVTWDDVATAWEADESLRRSSPNTESRLARGLQRQSMAENDFTSSGRSQGVDADSQVKRDANQPAQPYEPPLEQWDTSRATSRGRNDDEGIVEFRQTETDSWEADAELRIGDDLLFTGLGLAEYQPTKPSGPQALSFHKAFSTANDLVELSDRLAVTTMTTAVSGQQALFGEDAIRVDTKELWFVPPHTVKWNRAGADDFDSNVAKPTSFLSTLTVFPSRQAILREATRLFDAPSNDDEFLAQQHFLRQATADQQQQAQGDLFFGRWAVQRYMDVSPESFGLDAEQLDASKTRPWFAERYGKSAENLRAWSGMNLAAFELARKSVGKPHVRFALADGATVAAAEVEPQGNEPIYLYYRPEKPQDLMVTSVGDKVVVRTQLHEITKLKQADALWGLRFELPTQATMGDDVTIAGELTAKSSQERVVLEVPLPAGFTPSSTSATPYNADANVMRYYFDAIAPERPGKLRLSLQATAAGQQQAPPVNVYSMEQRGERYYRLPSFTVPVQAPQDSAEPTDPPK